PACSEVRSWARVELSADGPLRTSLGRDGLGRVACGETIAMISSPRSSSPPPPLAGYLLGLVDFDEVQQLQRRQVYDLGEHAGAALVLRQHPPTISVGRSGR